MGVLCHTCMRYTKSSIHPCTYSRRPITGYRPTTDHQQLTDDRPFAIDWHLWRTLHSTKWLSRIWSFCGGLLWDVSIFTASERRVKNFVMDITWRLINRLITHVVLKNRPDNPLWKINRHVLLLFPIICRLTLCAFCPDDANHPSPCA